jgi:hypothetical protein
LNWCRKEHPLLIMKWLCPVTTKSVRKQNFLSICYS